MKIISKFKDYYDSAQAFGSEPLVYVRKPVEDWLPKHDFGEDVKILSGYVIPGKLDFAERLTLFCGQCIPSFEILVRGDIRNISHEAYFDFESADEAVYKLVREDKHALLSYESGDMRDVPYWRRSQFGLSRKYLESFFTQSFSSDFDSIHHKHNAPVISYGKSSIFHETFNPFDQKSTKRLVKPEEVAVLPFDRPEKHPVLRCINPILSIYGFQKRFDPFQANQEISMYLGGVLSNVENNMVQIDDKSMRDAKGFDDRSFKKAPTKSR